MKRLSRYIEALRLGAVIDSKAPAGGAAAGQTIILPVYETIQVPGLGASSSSLTAFVNDNVSGQYILAGVVVNFGTASSSGTLQVERATSTQAVGGGSNQLSATVSLSGTANTPINGAIKTTPDTISAGDRLNLILGGTLTSLANCVVSLVLQRVA
jgi:hypothetical protein